MTYREMIARGLNQVGAAVIKQGTVSEDDIARMKYTAVKLTRIEAAKYGLNGWRASDIRYVIHRADVNSIPPFDSISTVGVKWWSPRRRRKRCFTVK